MCPQDLTADDELTGWENVLLIARLYGYRGKEAVERARNALEQMGLLDAASRRVSTYSGGMRRRLEIAMSLVHDPRVLFLDEPTLGLDVRSRRHLWDIIRGLRREGVAVLLTTHYMEEADELSDRVAVISRGRIIAEGSPEELKSRVGGERIYIRFRSGGEASTALTRLEELGLKPRLLQEDTLIVGSPGDLTSIISSISGLGIAELRIVKPNLEEVFLDLTGRRLSEDERPLDAFKYRVMSHRIRR